MTYRVTLKTNRLHDPIVSDKVYLSRSQAIHGMRLLAYDRLKAFGKLDTQSAHDVMAAIDKCDDILPPQDQRVVPISNTGYNLTLSNRSRAPR